ncbi:MAG: type II toxin-antitoxin system RelE/ParE family toxin [bacterium]|nr:type II toxin-antitoxin system RelE/ParE family toxin [bacterium]
MKVLFTPTARKQFLGAISYIRRDKSSAALKFREKAEDRLRRLQKFPDSGRHIPEFPDLPFREVIVPPYRFFYRVMGDQVWIVAVWHSAQLPDGPVR